MPKVIDFFIEKFRNNLELDPKPSSYYRPRPYRNAMVDFRNCSIFDFEERKEILVREAGLNPFLFRADKIPGCDLLSDSGTTTMTAEQWAAMLLGDEAYGSNEGYFRLKEQIAETFGKSWGGDTALGKPENSFIFHQGRAAESAFFSVLSRDLIARSRHAERSFSNDLRPELRERIESRCESLGLSGADPYYIIPSNSHFDTTEGNIEDKNMIALNLPCREHLENDEGFPFRGNMDIEELENLLRSEGDRVPLVYLTITNNTGGGQPVSMSNIKAVREITSKYEVPFFFDACRFAENAWFIRHKEDGFSERTTEDIVHEMFSHVDGFHISFKKDGLVNIGGAIFLKNGTVFDVNFPSFREELTDFQIMVEGHPTYGGLAGRDLKGIVEGLRTVTRRDYLNARISQVDRFGKRLIEVGIPIVRPIGGHAVYINVDEFFDGASHDEEFMGISLTALMLVAGHRLCELGTYAFGKFVGGREIPPDPRVNNVRAAVPRLAYEDQDLFSAAEAMKILYDERDRIPGVEVDYGRDLKLRHFKSRFSFK
jgi:tyrosine phenol-lyase